MKLNLRFSLREQRVGMDTKHVKWLISELPVLIEKNIIPQESAEKLRNYYGDAEVGDGRRIALIVCSILGAVLIGGGVILILAHNWDYLTRPFRTFLSLAPLVLAQLLAGWVTWRRMESAALREGAATFLMLAVGASIALISQTYHISGLGDNFLPIWMLLSVPLVYLMRANLPAVFYIAGITVWSAGAGEGHSYYYWPLAGLIIPHFWILAREYLFSNRLVVLSWVLAPSLCVAVNVTLPQLVESFGVALISGVFAIYYLGGSLFYMERREWWRQPFESLGAAGIIVISFSLTNQGIWENFVWLANRPGGAGTFNPLLVFGLPISLVTLCLLAVCVRRGRKGKEALGIAPLIVTLGYAFLGHPVSAVSETGIHDSVVIPAVLFNLYFFIIATATIISGIRNGRLVTVNVGMLLLAALILARFFDSDIGFAVRGVVFIVVGIGFLAANLVLLRRVKGGAA
ncbi:MAG: DUF2157 domain-containing protein [Bacillota bacterium]